MAERAYDLVMRGGTLADGSAASRSRRTWA
jgi:hypothetical protein